MLFNSLTFITFLSIFVIIFWLLNYPKFHKYFIFFSSLIFYGFWRIDFLPLLLFSVIFNYIAGFLISESKERKFIYLSFAVFINLLILFYFKYLIFFTDSIIGISLLFGIDLKNNFNFYYIILPLGISFYTFQAISYIVDIYRQNIKVEKDFLFYASYITFFPQLVAGPILRASQVIPQLKANKKINLIEIFEGFKRVLLGLCLKVFFADNIAIFVNDGFSTPAVDLSAIDVWTLAFLFGFQIYFDFSAYSHIAIGTAKMLGITFPENFNYPYLSSSPKEFWKRWHISLSSWIRDYLYLPLTNYSKKYSLDNFSDGISKITSEKRFVPLIITWSLMGLWHGSNWTFLLWGVLHALIIQLYRIFSAINLKINDNVKRIIGWLTTVPLIMITWISFRAENISDAFTMYMKIFNPYEYFEMNLRENIYLVTTIIFLIALSYGLFVKFFNKSNFKKNNKFFTNLIVYGVSIPILIIFLRPVNQFIYFQF
jgi:alginate O-acetyltransferase complex protein AlgI